MTLAMISSGDTARPIDKQRGWAAVCLSTMREGLELPECGGHSLHGASMEAGPGAIVLEPRPGGPAGQRARSPNGHAEAERDPAHSLERDRAVLEQQLTRLLPRLRRFALKLTKDPDEADDLVQAACERALSRFEQFEAGTRIDSWLYRICQTISVDRLRAARRRPDKVVIEEACELPFDARILETVEANLSLQHLHSAIGTLPHQQRLVLALAVAEEMSYSDIAHFLSVPVGTVMSRLNRARGRLRAALSAAEAVESA